MIEANNGMGVSVQELLEELLKIDAEKRKDMLVSVKVNGALFVTQSASDDGDYFILLPVKRSDVEPPNGGGPKLLTTIDEPDTEETIRDDDTRNPNEDSRSTR